MACFARTKLKGSSSVTHPVSTAFIKMPDFARSLAEV